jgi:iron complex outermembrane receptor protein
MHSTADSRGLPRVVVLARAIALTLAASAAGTAQAQAPTGRPAAAAGLDEIVVTARRVEERLMEVPIAITAYTAEEMARRNIQGIGDVAKYTAGVSFENYSGGTTPAIVIRGLSQTFLADRNQNVATFVDGVHVQQQGNVDFSLLELERIEVLKGPQNSQYGRSAFAGAVNYVPKAPVLGDWDASVAVTFGSDERLEARGGVSLPVISDKLAVRIYGVHSEFDGTWANRFPTGDRGVATVDSVIRRSWKGTDGNLGGYDNDAYRVAMTFRPIDSLTFDASYFDSKIRAENGAQTQIRPNAVALWGMPYQTNCSPNALGTLQLYCGELKADENAFIIDPRSNGNYADSKLVTAKAEWQATDSLRATYLYGKGDYFTSQFNQSATPPNPAREGCGVAGTPCTPATASQGYVLFAIGSVAQKSESHEIRIDGKFGDSIDWRLGYYTSEVNDESYQNSSERRRSLVNDPTGQVVVLSAGLPRSLFEDDNDSMFASVSWRFGAFTLDVEGRYTEEERLLVGSPIGKRKFDTFTPRVNLKWQPNDGAMYYGSVAKGAKAGGFNTILAPPGEETFDPETNMTYELGTKQMLFDSRLQLSAAVFYVDWTDLQVSTANLLPPPAGSTSRPNYTSNAAGASSLGVEVEAVALLSERWRLNFAGSYADPKYDDGTLDAGLGALCNSPQPVCTAVFTPRPPAPPAVSADIGGNTLARTPQSKLSAGLEYSTELAEWGFSGRADVSYQGKIYAESLNVGYFPARTLVDGSLTLTSPDKRWSASLWGRNLTDEVYTANAFVIGFVNFYNPTIGDGRTYGLTARFNY